MTAIRDGRYCVSPKNGGISLTVTVVGDEVIYNDNSKGKLSTLTDNNWIFEPLDDEGVIDVTTQP